MNLYITQGPHKGLWVVLIEDLGDSCRVQTTGLRSIPQASLIIPRGHLALNPTKRWVSLVEQGWSELRASNTDIRSGRKDMKFGIYHRTKGSEEEGSLIASYNTLQEAQEDLPHWAWDINQRALPWGLDPTFRELYIKAAE